MLSAPRLLAIAGVCDSGDAVPVFLLVGRMLSLLGSSGRVKRPSRRVLVQRSRPRDGRREPSIEPACEY